MTDKEILIAAVSGKEPDKRAAAWIRKAGGMEGITEGMAARIVKLYRLREPEQESHKM